MTGKFDLNIKNNKIKMFINSDNDEYEEEFTIISLYISFKP